MAGAYVAGLAPAHQRGLYMGTYGMVWSVAFVGGPSLGMLLFSVSPLGLWISCGVLGTLAAAIILAGPRPGKVGAGSEPIPVLTPPAQRSVQSPAR